MSDTLIAGGHSPATDWEGQLTDMEAKAEVDSLEDLQQQRRELIAKHARTIALHGSFGLFDDKRKQMLEAQKIVARRKLTEAGSKITEGMVDAEAYGSAAYQNLLDEAIDAKVELLTAQNRIDELNEKIRNRETMLYLYGQEAKLAR